MSGEHKIHTLISSCGVSYPTCNMQIKSKLSTTCYQKLEGKTVSITNKRRRTTQIGSIILKYKQQISSNFRKTTNARILARNTHA